MSSRYCSNIAANDDSKLLSPPDFYPELLQSLTTLTTKVPPRKYTARDCQGLYSGPTSVAYLFFRISRLHPDLMISGRKPLQWASDYLQDGREGHFATAEKCGVVNEQLAFYAVRAAVTQDTKDVEKLVKHAGNAALTLERGSDEWLYGRAGCLYLLRLARGWVRDSASIVDSLVEQVIEDVLSHGPAWPWHGKDYLGAVHGRIGVITQVVMSDPSRASDPTILASLDRCLKLQTSEGNWPSSAKSRSSHLVQFCHGAPGIVLSLRAIQEYFSPELHEKIDIACKLAEKCIMEKGLLSKEPCLCHGITGNALALPWAYQKHFMSYTVADAVRKGKKEGLYAVSEDPYGLFTGEAGRAWGWYVLLTHGDKGIRGMIGYTDV